MRAGPQEAVCSEILPAEGCSKNACVFVRVFARAVLMRPGFDVCKICHAQELTEP
jgi:hypothetical protein